MTNDERRMILAEDPIRMSDFIERANDHARKIIELNRKFETAWAGILFGHEPYSPERVIEMLEKYISELSDATYDFNRIAVLTYDRFRERYERVD